MLSVRRLGHQSSQISPATRIVRQPELPAVSHWLLRWFAQYSGYYLRRHFHRLHLAGNSEQKLERLRDLPLLICLNHPSWWDPLLAIYLSQRLFAERGTQYAPIASKGLEKYRFFERLGFFGIDSETRGGARRFLTLGRRVLAEPRGVLWVTGQGRFTDVRERPVRLFSGLGHLASSAPGKFAILPLCLEYAFWEESAPEAFVFLGEPLLVESGTSNTADGWTQTMESQLEQTQTELSRLVMARDETAFEPLLAGRAGIGGMYDLWRMAKAAIQGKRFEAAHGQRVQRSRELS